MRGHRLVKFTRRFEPGHVMGYVAGVGKGIALLAYVDQTIRFDGFQVFRSRDLRRLRPAPTAGFVETALRLRGDQRPALPRLHLDGFGEVIRSAGRHFPLVTIHREGVDSGVCHIGKVVDVDARRVTLLEIQPDATWDTDPESYLLGEITRVDFGGGYEDALFAVGGAPPEREDKSSSALPVEAPRR